MARLKLTKRNIDAIDLPDRQADYRDTELKGYCLRVFASGRKQFMLLYRMDGRRKAIKLGDYGALTPEQARTIAKEKLNKVANDIDPQEEAKIKREMPTFKQWADEYLAEAEKRMKRPDQPKRYLEMAKERFGKKKLDAVTRADIQNQMKQLQKAGKTNAVANQYHARLRSCFAEAVSEGLIDKNPCAGIKRYPEPLPRSRTLTDKEMKATLEAIDELDNQFAQTALHMMIETGCRKSEALSAKWTDINFDDAIWRLPDTKSGKPQVIPLSVSIMAKLRLLPRTDAPFLFPGTGRTGHLADVKKPWEAIRKAAGIPDVRLHDVRRTFGLHIARKAGLHVASKLLRHSSIKVTESHYAPLGIDELRDALKKRSADVLPLEKKS
jgi:integrase